MVNWVNKSVLGGQFLHVRCLAHIVNIIVRSGLKTMERSVASIRNAIRFVRNYNSRLDTFKKCVEQEKLQSKKNCVLDVPTRWNSTYIMLDTALELRITFDRLAEEKDVKYTSYFEEDEELDDRDEEETEAVVDSRNRVGPPIDEDWDKAEVFVKYLKIFYDVTVRVSAQLHPTSSKAFHDIVARKAELDD
ncbi:hypothetical protein M0R45_001038 [Rubus argutus]|uniref:Zinc finger BED domain-containing protein RICESLEEPER 2-like n=1 Tax=Rubus argutus TaxID=59490 RepID=A0AAW1VIR6_RUBAR